MPGCSRNDIILVRYPFSDLTTAKVRPAVVVGVGHRANDYLIVPLTSRIDSLGPAEFILRDWVGCGLRIASAVKRGIYTIHDRLIIKSVGKLSSVDIDQLNGSLRKWLELP